MQIEAGKFYRTRDGRKVGPMRDNCNTVFKWRSGEQTWTDEGSFNHGWEANNDLIAEWTDEPDETTAAIRGVIAASEPRPAFAELQPDGSIKPLSILGALEPLLAIGTVPALLAAGDVIRREIARLEEGAK